MLIILVVINIHISLISLFRQINLFHLMIQLQQITHLEKDKNVQNMIVNVHAENNHNKMFVTATKFDTYVT